MIDTESSFLLGSAIPPEARGKYSGISVRGPPAFYPQLRFASRTFTADIQVNFGDKPFRFDIVRYCTLTGNRFSKFKRDAASLPSEILHRILTLAVSIHPDAPGSVNPLQPADTPLLNESCSTLSRLALVCRHWARHSRSALYHSVVLRNQKQTKRFKSLVLKSPEEWYPGLFVHLLGTVDAASPEIGLLLLSTLPRRLKRLKTLIWGQAKLVDSDEKCMGPSLEDNRYPPQFLVMMPCLFQAFSALRYLTLRGLRLSSFSRLARLVCSIAKLETLGLDNVSWQEPTPNSDVLPGWFRRSRHLRRIETNDMEFLGSSRCLGDIVWFFVGRLSIPPYHLSPPLSEELPPPHFDDFDATVISSIFVSVATRQFESCNGDDIFSSAYVITLEEKRHRTEVGCKSPSRICCLAACSRRHCRGVNHPKRCCGRRMDTNTPIATERH